MATNEKVFGFLRALAAQPEERERLRLLSKDEVLAWAREAGHDFPEQDFDDTAWGFEEFLAGRMGEGFDQNFSLWETMWGTYYLDYLVENVGAAATDEIISEFLGSAS